jgi:hypothetical protein
MDSWQQFVIKARDERGDGIADYNLQLYKVSKGKIQNMRKIGNLLKLTSIHIAQITVIVVFILIFRIF